MPFSEPFETYFHKIIKPAVDDNELYSVRGDSLFRSTHIMDDIWNSINESSVVIAELTGKNANVFYELGLAHALGKPAILISSNLDDVPFDLRPLRVLIYDKNDPSWGSKLQENISNAIKETLESPAEAIPHTFRNYKKPETGEEITLSRRLKSVESKLELLSINKFNNVESAFLNNESIEFKIGDLVTHAKFGEGQIVRFEGEGENARLHVNFNAHGLKWLMNNFARLKLV